MFADSLLETSWAQRGRRSWTTLTSFGLQAVVIGTLLMIPLLTTVGIPMARTASTPISMGRPEPAPMTPAGHFHSTAVAIVPYSGRIMAPGRIPDRVVNGGDEPSSGPTDGGPGIAVGVYSGPNIGMALPITGTRPIMPTPAPTPTKPVFRTSSMLQGSLIRRVEPVYPPLARAARIQGSVQLAAIISKDGTIENLRTISGHPMLVPAAVEAVRQWRYRPYILNSEPIEVETQITVNFTLN